jgi:HAD superfamily hydrolase (TIGR01509 family)
MEKPRVILFDLDGLVIVGKKKLFSERIAEEKHIPLEKVQEFFQNDFRECSFGRADLKEKLAPYLVKWDYNGSVEDFLQYWFETESTTDKEVLEIVSDLRKQGIPCYIATRQEKYRKEYLLEIVGLKNSFDGIFCTCDIGYDKWEKEYWDSVCKSLHLKPEEIMFFCDSQKNIDSSKTLGVNAYFYGDIVHLKEVIEFIK